MKKKGFTLIELLAVIVILSVVAIITVVVIGNVIEEAKIKKYYSEEKAMEHAAELYLVKNQNSLEKDVSTQEIGLQTLITAKNMKPVHDTGNGGVCDGKVLVEVNKQDKKNIKDMIEANIKKQRVMSQTAIRGGDKKKLPGK